MKNCFKSMVCGWRSFIKPALLLFFLSVVSITVVSCSKDRGLNQFHIQGQLVELGTNMPLRHAGVKFIIFKSHKSSPLVSAIHIPVDSFETDANGQYDYIFRSTEELDNFELKVVSTVFGYFGNTNSYSLARPEVDFRRIHLSRKVLFNFIVDNSEGRASDLFSFIMSGMSLLHYFSGNGIFQYSLERPAFVPFEINFGDWQKDSSYLIPVFIDSLETYTVVHKITN